MIFGTLAICIAALTSVTEASRHQHYGRNHGVHARFYGNDTTITPTIAPTAVSSQAVVSPTPIAANSSVPVNSFVPTTNSSVPAAPTPTTYFNQTNPGVSPPPVPGTPSLDFTTTLVQTTTKYSVVTLTLSDGQKVVTTVTQCETTTRTIGHVKETLTVSPLLEAVPSISPTPLSPTPLSPTPLSPTPLPPSPLSSTSTVKSTSTSTVTTVIYVTMRPSGTLTVVPKPTCSPSVTTVYVPSLTTVYNTVTVSVTPSHRPEGSHRNATSFSKESTTTRTSTTTATIYMTVTLPTHSNNTTSIRGGY